MGLSGHPPFPESVARLGFTILIAPGRSPGPYAFSYIAVQPAATAAGSYIYPLHYPPRRGVGSSQDQSTQDCDRMHKASLPQREAKSRQTKEGEV